MPNNGFTPDQIPSAISPDGQWTKPCARFSQNPIAKNSSVDHAGHPESEESAASQAQQVLEAATADFGLKSSVTSIQT